MAETRFPHGFLWGAATSSHQVEGGNTNNDWWAWEQAGRVKERSGAACEQYERFEQDFDLAAQLGHNAHRFSIEWSRVEPQEGVFSDEALAQYRQVAAALRRRSIEPVVTLHHYTNPLWLSGQGGWLNPKVVERFERYTRSVVEALGEQVRYWLTINEPMVYAVMHYLDGVGPPGEQSVGSMFRVVEHLIRAHAAGFHAIHEIAAARGWEAQVSLAMHAQPFEPCRGWWIADRVIASMTERVYNQGFLNALAHGVYELPGRKPRRIPDARGSLDFIGLNYYGRIFMRWADLRSRRWWGVRCSTRHHRQVRERNCLDWDVYPPGILRVLRWALPYGLPVLITENGICTDDDAQRERFIVSHLRVVAEAMQAGVPVIGYLYWSLLDNFEWAHGYGPRFGLVEMDYATQQRRVRPSARRFAEICRTNRLPPE